MSYRNGPCTFCDQDGQAACPRCAAWVCASHDVGDVGDKRFCGMCAKELKDDLEEAGFTRAVGHSNDHNGVFAPQGQFSGAPRDAFQRLADAISGWFDGHRVQKTFDARSPEEVAAWRKRAGVFVRVP